MRSHQLKAVLFDFGDTLFERHGGHEAVIRAATRLGAMVSEADARALWDSIQARARTPEELALGRDLSAEAHRDCWISLYRPADAITPGMAELLYDYEIGPTFWTPFPEVPDVLARLRQAGLGIGVVSDTGFDIRAVFAVHGLIDLVDVFVLSAEHGVVKPHPTLFDHACTALGAEPATTLMVGDNPLTDGGAAALGVRVLIVPPPARRPERALECVVSLAGERGRPIPQR
jgi:FMN phosphatase YigB (HAD superfamily)